MATRFIAGFALTVAWLMTVSSTAGAQQTGCQHDAFGRLIRLVGAWEVTTMERLAPEEYEESRGAAMFRLLFDCTIQETRHGSRGGEAYQVVSLISVPSDDEVQYLHVDSEHGRFMVSTGGWSGDTLVVDWSRQIGERTMSLRRRLVLVLPDSFVAEHHLRPSDDAEWALVWRGSYRPRR